MAIGGGRHRAGRLLVLLLAASVILAACGSPSGSGRHQRGTTTTAAPSETTSTAASPGTAPTTSARKAPAHFSHVFVVVMENLSYDAALATPGFADLAHRYGYLSRYYAASHPSLPNYLALTGGSTFGITSDCLTCYVNADNLAAQLATARISWGAFMQGVTTPCYLGTSYGIYAAKHNPFRYFRDVRSSRSLCGHLLPLPRLYGDLTRPATAVPRFTWVTPDVCHDGHSCPLQAATGFLSGFVAKVTASAAWRHGGVLFVTWDEASSGDSRQITPTGQVETSGGGGHVLTLVIAPGLRGGVRLSAPLDHYGLLATIEQGFGLPLLDKAAAWKGHTLTRRLLPAAG